MNFKIIALRSIKGCNPNYLKTLKEEIPYVFYNKYDFSKYNESKKISLIKEYDMDLYSVTNKNIKINISAVVGKNGSGKSSILELIYVAIYNLSAIKGILFNEMSNKYLTQKDIISGINVEIFYELNEHIYKLMLEEEKVSLYEIFVDDDNISLIGFSWENFFYTIAVNYSHYALNSLEIGSWVNYVFHKNDAYQTPLVINPMRTEGNIDVNKENYLVKSRLLANILSEDSNLRILAEKKVVKYLKFSLDNEKIEKKSKGNIERYKVILPFLYEEFLNNKSFQPKNSKLDSIAQLYILGKINDICKKYKQYKKFRNYFSKEENTKHFKRYAVSLKKDTSHITFKLRQAINFLRYGSCINESQLNTLVDVNVLVEKIGNIHKQASLNLIDIIPPSFFDVEIFFDDKNNNFEKLSSGEKQKIYSISSLIYHIINIESVPSNVDNIIKYRNINVVFDEIELYYHPDLQRTFINDLLERINNIKFNEKLGLNFIFITHSPFILSDIPSANILFLDDVGMPKSIQYFEDLETFGANIHDLLKDSFFLNKGAMGEFAKNTINNTIHFLNYNKLKKELECRKENCENILEWKQDELDALKIKIIHFDEVKHHNLINIIGEPILQRKLSEMFDDVFGTRSELEVVQKKIKKLREIEKRLK